MVRPIRSTHSTSDQHDLTGDVQTSVTVQYPAVNPTFTSTVQVTPGSVTIVTLPVNAAQLWSNNTVSGNTVLATSQNEFVAYMLNLAGATSDAALALPIDALNTEYIVMDWPVNGMQFAVFARDYFGDYRARSAARYEYNVRGAIEQLVAWHDRAPGAQLYLNDDVLFIRGFWDYYLRVLSRRDLHGREIMFDSQNGLPADVAAGSLILTDVNSRAMAALQARGDLVQVAHATDPEPGTSPPIERTTFVIFQKP